MDISKVCNANYKFKSYMKIFILILSVIYSLGAIFYGCPFTDTFYYLNSFTSGDVHRYFEGTQLLVKFWLRCFGDNILLLRFFDWSFYTLSFVLAYVWFVPHKKQNVHFLALPFILQTTFSLNYFNADSITLLCVVMLCKCLNSLMYENNIYKSVIFTTIIIVISILIRFTNIVAIPIIFVFLIITGKIRELWKQTILISVLPILVYVVAIILLYGGIGEYFHPTVVATSCGTKHTIKSLVYYYIQDGKVFIQYFPFCMLLLAVPLRSDNNKWLSFGLKGFCILYLLLYFKYHVQLSVACGNLSIFVSALFISIICMLLIFDINRKKWNINSEMMLLIVMLSMINPAGSDSAFLKLVWGVVAFSPLILLYYNECFSMNKMYLKILMLILVFYSMYNFYKKPMPCVPSIKELNCEIDDSRLKHIRVSEYRKKLYDNVKIDLEKYNEDYVVFYGMQAHGLYYLNGIDNVLESDFFMYGNDVYNAENMVKTIKQYKPLVFYMPFNGDLTIVEDSLITHGYYVIDENDCYKLYYTK